MSGRNPLDRDRDGDVDRRDLEVGTSQTSSQRRAQDTGEVAIPVAEERLNVQTRETELGEVQVHKSVTQEQVSVPVELEREEVNVQQRDVADRPAQAGDQLFQEGTITVPVRGEEAVVQKEAVVTGEVVIGKDRTVERQQVSDTVRRERVEVDENYNQHRSGFQQHFTQRQSSLQGQGQTRTWEEAEPNYQYGYATARDARYQGREFDDVEPDLRRDYETRYGGSMSRTGTSGSAGSMTGGTSGTTGSMTGSTSGGAGDAWQHLREEIREGWTRARGR